MKTKKVVWALTIIFALSFMGCKNIEKEQAESIAKAFVGKNVGFYAKGEEVPVSVPNYELTVRDNIKEGKTWVVVIHISSIVNNETKGNDVAVRINNEGKVIEFNGVKLIGKE